MSVRVLLYLESPSARNNVSSLWNVVYIDFNPGFSFLKFEELSLESFYPVFLLFAGHPLSERRHIRVGTLDGFETERVNRDGSIDDVCFPIMEKKRQIGSVGARVRRLIVGPYRMSYKVMGE
jgi:hypothetical protein